MSFYNKKENKKLRQILRSQRSFSEKLLWQKLRNYSLDYKFRRQHGIGSYVVDFYCRKLKLVIEIDGATHSSEEEIEKDKIRQKFLEDNGLIVKRYRNIDIKNSIGGVLEDLSDFIKLKNLNNPTKASP